MYKLECPWGGPDLEIYKLETWTTMAIVSFFGVLIYPIGVPLFMYFLMRHNGVPRLARRKVANSLTTSMIVEYKKDTTTASSQKLASYVGLPPRMEGDVKRPTGDQKDVPVDDGFQRRLEEVYLDIYPEHRHCDGSCEGHALPLKLTKFLAELNHPVDISALALASKQWFDRIDLDASGSCELDELEEEFIRYLLACSSCFRFVYFLLCLPLNRTQLAIMIKPVCKPCRIGLTREEASTMMTAHDTDGGLSLDEDEFFHMLMVC